MGNEASPMGLISDSAVSVLSYRTSSSMCVDIVRFSVTFSSWIPVIRAVARVYVSTHYSGVSSNRCDAPTGSLFPLSWVLRSLGKPLSPRLRWRNADITHRALNVSQWCHMWSIFGHDGNTVLWLLTLFAYVCVNVAGTTRVVGTLICLYNPIMGTLHFCGRWKTFGQWNGCWVMMKISGLEHN